LTVAIICRAKFVNEFVVAGHLPANDKRLRHVKFYNLTGQYSTDWGEMLGPQP